MGRKYWRADREADRPRQRGLLSRVWQQRPVDIGRGRRWRSAHLERRHARGGGALRAPQRWDQMDVVVIGQQAPPHGKRGRQRDDVGYPIAIARFGLTQRWRRTSIGGVLAWRTSSITVSRKIRLFAFGMRPPATRFGASSWPTTASSSWPLSVLMARELLRGARIELRGCGTLLPAGSLPTSRAREVDLLGGLEPGWIESRHRQSRCDREHLGCRGYGAKGREFAGRSL